jgi:hypothetical protein
MARNTPMATIRKRVIALIVIYFATLAIVLVVVFSPDGSIHNCIVVFKG